MDTCWNCGQTTQSGEKLCPRCNADLTADRGNFCRCSNGHIVSQGSQFCPWCGESISPASGSEFDLALPAGNAEPSHSSRRTIRLPQPKENRTVIVRRGRETDSGGGQPALTGFLVSFSLSEQGTYFPLREGRQTIGKDRTMRIHIDDELLSGEHAVILFRKGRFIFEDRLSSNGSEVNGREAAGQIDLKHGDILTMGSHTFTLVVIPARLAGDPASKSAEAPRAQS
jgi:RNA polymerase subunit RPABC4/transcription elongation factor Spt4